MTDAPRDQETDGAEYDGDHNRPALSRLSWDQAAMLDQLIQGFADRRELLDWLQDVGIYTMGTVPDAFPRRLATSAALVDILVVDDGRDRDDVLVGETAKEFREILAADLAQYCTDGVREFRASAGEYINPDDRPNPADSDAPALRPGLAELDGRQESVLSTLLDGEIRTTEQAINWSQSLTLATFGEIDREFAAKVRKEGATTRIVVATDDEPAEHAVARERIAATRILPACNAGVRSLRDRSAEDTERKSGELTAKSL